MQKQELKTKQNKQPIVCDAQLASAELFGERFLGRGEGSGKCPGFVWGIYWKINCTGQF